ncbi:hypothetical protein [Pelomonas sp. KK5]|uniref:hypothetical protein n=1 Tax=Pelomonas sp. KK5 TaxID=1855730 RepID=UPI00097C6376|nr:hypothetical protein [Pelomonas sp. KK5]
MRLAVLLLLLAACATQPDAPALSPQAAQQALAAAPPTRAGVAAALGPAAQVHFDSGYEAWVYRWPDGAELVLLFAPDGTLSRQRQRAAAADR